MSFFKKSQLKSNGKWYPRSIVVGDPATTQEIADRLAEISTVSRSDTYAVLQGLSSVLKSFMKEGRSAKLDGVGTFYYTADASKQGVDTPEEVSAKQIKGVRVRWTTTSSGTTSPRWTPRCAAPPAAARRKKAARRRTAARAAARCKPRETGADARRPCACPLRTTAGGRRFPSFPRQAAGLAA